MIWDFCSPFMLRMEEAASCSCDLGAVTRCVSPTFVVHASSSSFAVEDLKPATLPLLPDQFALQTRRSEPLVAGLRNCSTPPCHQLTDPLKEWATTFN